MGRVPEGQIHIGPEHISVAAGGIDLNIKLCPVDLQMTRRKEEIDALLGTCRDRFALVVLRPFVAMNGVSPGQLLRLSTALREARENKPLVRDKKIAWEAIAVFALYTYFQVTDIADLANNLHMSRPTVKRWVSAIYEAFEVAQEDFTDRGSRRQELRRRALEEGYLKDTFWLRCIPLDLDGAGLA